MATKRSVLSEIRLLVDGSGGVDVGRIRRSFPTVHVHVARADAPPTSGALRALSVADVRYESWHSTRFDFWLFDRCVDERVEEGQPLVLRAPARHASRFALEVLTRAQRRIERRNDASRTELFDRILAAHSARSDLRQGSVRGDHDHALDRWQWTLRLDPGASAACQIAALLRDVQGSETGEDAADDGAGQESDVGGGASLAAALVRDAGGDEVLGRAVERLLDQREAPAAGTWESALIDDADALSFVSMSSPGFVDHFGAQRARKKLARTIATMSARALEELPRIRLRPDVAALVAETLEAPVRQIEAVG